MSVPDEVKQAAFDPDGEIKSQADAKAFGEWLIEQRRLRAQAKDDTKEDNDGKPVCR